VSNDEVFDEVQINMAIKQFLDYGEESFAPDKDFGHGGYFSGGGWAAKCLRYHLEQRGIDNR